MRCCVRCGVSIEGCMGFVLVRDAIRAWGGERIQPRELCGKCGAALMFFMDEHECTSESLVKFYPALI